MKIKKTGILILIFFLTTSHSFFAQEKLTKFNTSWSNVLPGTVICEPEETSYGFCLVTDARTAAGFSDKGVQLWEKPIGQSRNVSLTVIKDDFILIHEKNDNILKLLNPSGSSLWSFQLDFNLREKPLAGRDGRFFIYSDRNISCYGINGIKKWTIETPLQKQLPVQELPDGTLIIFLSDSNNKTLGLRISPFGEVLEEITFSGSIKKCFSFEKGVLLIFTDGSAGLFSVENGKSVNKWVIQQKNDNSIFVVSHDKSDFVLLNYNGNSFVINYISKDDGIIQNKYEISGINTSQIQKLYLNNNGLFICDNKNAFLINQNKTIWNAALPDINQLNYNYLIYLNQNYLIFCSKDWSIDGYRTSQNVQNTVYSSTYSDLYIKNPINKISLQYTKNFDSYLTDDKRIFTLANGNFENNENQLTSEILFLCEIYANDLVTENTGVRQEASVFDLDKSGFQKILQQLTLICNDDSQRIAASIIKKSGKKDCKYLISKISGYDPDGLLLDALEVKAEKINYKDNGSIKVICDAVYEICKYMGRPAYNTKGKTIIKKFMDSNNDLQSRLYARDTLKKILALNL